MKLCYGAFVAGCLLLLSDYSKNEECTRVRSEASDVWKDVHEKAGKWKLQGATGYEDYDARQKAEHYRIWNAIESGAESVWQAFAFEKITWSSARPGRDSATKEFKSYWAADKYTSFQALLDGANRQFDAVAAVCK